MKARIEMSSFLKQSIFDTSFYPDNLRFISPMVFLYQSYTSVPINRKQVLIIRMTNTCMPVWSFIIFLYLFQLSSNLLQFIINHKLSKDDKWVLKYRSFFGLYSVISSMRLVFITILLWCLNNMHRFLTDESKLYRTIHMTMLEVDAELSKYLLVVIEQHSAVQKIQKTSYLEFLLIH